MGHFLGDGGSEHLSLQWLSFLGYMVGTNVFKQIYFHRLPTKHTECDVDSLFQRLSVMFHGNCLREGIQIQNYDDYLCKLKEFYKENCAALGGPPGIFEADCVYDWMSFIHPYVDPDFSGDNAIV